MNERFRITEMFICPFDKENGFYKADFNYPMRYCLIDESRKVAIDIEQELEYDYIETLSMLYFINESQKRIVPGKRVAIFPTTVLDVDLKLVKKAKKIINKINHGHEFMNGNDILNNEDYLNVVKKNDEKVKIYEKER